MVEDRVPSPGAVFRDRASVAPPAKYLARWNEDLRQSLPAQPVEPHTIDAIFNMTPAGSSYIKSHAPCLKFNTFDRASAASLNTPIPNGV